MVDNVRNEAFLMLELHGVKSATVGIDTNEIIVRFAVIDIHLQVSKAVERARSRRSEM